MINNGGEKLLVKVPTNKGCPVVRNSTKLANELGVEIRLRALLQQVTCWGEIPEPI
ncbi:unnamed protein product [Camellia sinensis]